MKSVTRALICTGLAWSAAAGTTSMAQEIIGTPEWVSQRAIGQPPEAGQRQLAPGLPVVHRESVATDTTGVADFFFNNSSRLLVGPECSLVLDERFYDPALDREVVSIKVESDTFCVAQIEEVRALLAAGQVLEDIPEGSLSAQLGESAGEQLALVDDAAAQMPDADLAMQVPGLVLMQTTVSSVIVADANALFGVGPGNLGMQVIKTSGAGVVVVDTGDTSVAIRRAGFTVRVSSNGTVTGPERADTGTVRLLQARLESPADGPDQPDLPYILEQVSLLPPPPPFTGDPFRSQRPDQCALSDTCLGLDRIFGIDVDDDLIIPEDLTAIDVN